MIYYKNLVANIDIFFLKGTATLMITMFYMKDLWFYLVSYISRRQETWCLDIASHRMFSAMCC